MTEHWPRWWTVHPDQVRDTLPPEEWGGYAQGSGAYPPGTCINSGTEAWGLTENKHPTDWPLFFHCASCLQHRKPPKRWTVRDAGLCVRCKHSTATLRKDVAYSDVTAARTAEAQGITVARLRTRKWCSECDPHARPFCNCRDCQSLAQEGKPRRRALPLGCCDHTNKRPHCERTCKRYKGVCIKCKKQPAAENRKHCRKCLDVESERMRQKRANNKLGRSRK